MYDDIATRPSDDTAVKLRLVSSRRRPRTDRRRHRLPRFDGFPVLASTDREGGPRADRSLTRKQRVESSHSGSDGHRTFTREAAVSGTWEIVSHLPRYSRNCPPNGSHAKLCGQ